MLKVWGKIRKMKYLHDLAKSCLFLESRGRHVGADIPADEQISLREYST